MNSTENKVEVLRMNVQQGSSNSTVQRSVGSLKSNSPSWMSWLGGLAFTFVIALISYYLGKIPGLDHIGQLACAILIAVLYRQFAGYPEVLKPGIQFASKRLLRFAIILFGLKLNMDVVLHQGLGLLARDVVTIIFAIAATLLLAKWFKADLSLSLLLGIGTGVCGAAAIAAVSPIVKAKEEDTAIGAGLIALIGTLFAITYTVIRPFLPLTPTQYGTWAGISLHEIAHVALAGAPAGTDGLAIALLAKLGRVFLLVPLSFILLYWMKRKNKGQAAAAEEAGSKIEFPWFLIGFVLMSLFGSYVLGKMIIVPTAIMNDLSFLTSFMLTMAMIGLGLNVSLRDVRNKAMRPLLVMVIVSVLLSGLAYLII
jgi:uncharacterized integral membrane protein (TIGR00698 family)